MIFGIRCYEAETHGTVMFVQRFIQCSMDLRVHIMNPVIRPVIYTDRGFSTGRRTIAYHFVSFPFFVELLVKTPSHDFKKSSFYEHHFSRHVSSVPKFSVITSLIQL